MTILGVAMLFPLFWGLYHGEPTTTVFTVAVSVTTGSGLLLWRLTPAAKERFSRREALLLVTGVWALSSVFGAIPYYLGGVFPSFLDAYFEAMSSFTTTGATVLNNIEAQYQSILIWRNFSQWLGGMGIITLFVALFPMLGMGAAHLVDAELPGPQTEKLTVRLRDTIKSLWFLYLGFSVVEFLLLWQAGRLPVFDSVIITFGTMPTGGFAATSLSIGAYNSVIVDVIVIVFMAIAGVNFGLHYLFLGRRQPSHLFNNPEFRIYIILLVGASVLIASNLMHVMALPAADSFRHGFFQSVSIMTTTGFSTVDFNLWPSFSRTVLLMLMIIGASSGSTGGALKITRFIVLFKYTFRRISLTFNPQAVIPIKVGGTVLNERVISGIIGMAVLYFTCIFVGFLIMAGLGLDPVSALSSVLATLGNVGPGLGVVGPLASYAAIPAVGKVVLILAMLAGRLELITIFALLAPSFWKWR